MRRGVGDECVCKDGPRSVGLVCFVPVPGSGTVGEWIGRNCLDFGWSLVLKPGRAWPLNSGVMEGEDKPRPVPSVIGGAAWIDNLFV